MKKSLRKIALASSLLLGSAGVLLTSCNDNRDSSETKIIRIGHFPNVTHVQALVARNMARHGNDWFAERLPGYTLEWYVYNAGPSAMEAFFARSIDMTYVGPSPAINAYAKSKGTEARIVAGAVNGASALVVQPDENIRTVADFLGKTISTPQLGNTQDVSCRAWLNHEGFKVVLNGATAPDAMKTANNFTTPSNGVDVAFMPMANPELLASFKQKKIDAAWTVEPWISRMENEGGGKIFIEEKSAVTTVLSARAKWMQDNPDLLAKMVKAHRELTEWIIANPEKAQEMVVEELSEITKTPVKKELIASAWKRMILTNEISRQGLEDFVKSAQDAGLINSVPPLDGLIAPPVSQ